MDRKFIYDGWNLIAILAADNSRVQSFTWGYDLSGTLQGAGGVGGLKALTVHTGPEAGSYFCAYDGNGNVVGLVNAANGGIAAQYEYGPFGEIIRATGPMAKVNPFRFSTKYQDDETDLLYYGYRYYSASSGRWLTRDPLQEVGSTCLYTAAWNDLLNAVDVDVRYGWSDLRNDASGIQAVMVDNWSQFRNWGVNNWRQARPRVADATQRALGTIDNVVFFYDWIFERGDELRSYKDGDRLVELLKRSRGIEKALSRYKEAGCPQALRGNYGTMEGYRDVTLGGEFLNPAHFQIGGYIWDIEKLGPEKVKIKIVNHASRRSLVGEPTARQDIYESQNLR